MEMIAEYNQILLILACAVGFFMAWGVGANDVANAMGTSVGSRALTVKQAIIVAMFFEFFGAYLAGGEVTSTIRRGIIDSAAVAQSPDALVLGMIASLLAAGLWLLIASAKGWPVSTTHTIVGAIIGFACVALGVDQVKWDKVGTIVSSWVVSPILAGAMAFFIFHSVQRLVLDTDNPTANARKYIPFYMFGVGFVIALVTVMKGLKHVFEQYHTSLSAADQLGIAVGCGIAVMIIGRLLLNRIGHRENASRHEQYLEVEKLFGVLMVFTACAMAFAHGSNDVANAIGPLAAVVNVLNTGAVAAKAALPNWILLLGAGGIVVGLATFGFKVMATVGEKITELVPSRGFAAELGAATTVVLASGTGLPISTTHTLVGAVLGVGLARGIGSIDLRVVGQIFSSWVVTLPAGAGLCVIIYWILCAIFMP